MQLKPVHSLAKLTKTMGNQRPQNIFQCLGLPFLKATWSSIDLGNGVVKSKLLDIKPLHITFKRTLLLSPRLICRDSYQLRNSSHLPHWPSHNQNSYDDWFFPCKCANRWLWIKEMQITRAFTFSLFQWIHQSWYRYPQSNFHSNSSVHWQYSQWQNQHDWSDHAQQSGVSYPLRWTLTICHCIQFYIK